MLAPRGVIINARAAIAALFLRMDPILRPFTPRPERIRSGMRSRVIAAMTRSADPT